jgi:hypothetical protein
MAAGDSTPRSASSSEDPSDGAVAEGAGSRPTRTPMVWPRQMSGNAMTLPAAPEALRASTA